MICGLILDSLAIQGDMIYLASLEHHARDPRLAVTNGDQWLWVKIIRRNRRNSTDNGIHTLKVDDKVEKLKHLRNG